MTGLLVGLRQRRRAKGDGVVTSEKLPVRRWMQSLNRVMPVLLDTAGIILLSGSAMMWDPIAGTAAAGLGCFLLNKRHYDDGDSSHGR